MRRCKREFCGGTLMLCPYDRVLKCILCGRRPDQAATPLPPPTPAEPEGDDAGRDAWGDLILMLREREGR
jgi:hypothetical protein